MSIVNSSIFNGWVIALSIIVIVVPFCVGFLFKFLFKVDKNLPPEPERVYNPENVKSYIITPYNNDRKNDFMGSEDIIKTDHTNSSDKWLDPSWSILPENIYHK
jgi:hypothetical protein